MSNGPEPLMTAFPMALLAALVAKRARYSAGATREEHLCRRRGNPRRKPSERELDRRAPADCSPDRAGHGPGALQRRQQAPLARSRRGEVHRVRPSNRDLPNCECCELRGSVRVGLDPSPRGTRAMTTHITGTREWGPNQFLDLAPWRRNEDRLEFPPGVVAPPRRVRQALSQVVGVLDANGGQTL
jgi:hypothetical protein